MARKRLGGAFGDLREVLLGTTLRVVRCAPRGSLLGLRQPSATPALVSRKNLRNALMSAFRATIACVAMAMIFARPASPQ